MKKLLLFIIVVATFVAMMVSCNVTRVVTTESKSVQRGDTAVMIQSKTIESYDASKRGNW